MQRDASRGTNDVFSYLPDTCQFCGMKIASMPNNFIGVLVLNSY